jgi:hypothetical protein
MAVGGGVGTLAAPDRMKRSAQAQAAAETAAS